MKETENHRLRHVLCVMLWNCGTVRQNDWVLEWGSRQLSPTSFTPPLPAHICCWGDAVLIQRGTFHASEISLHSMACRVTELWGRSLKEISNRLSWCFLLILESCPSAGAGRSCLAWNWAYWWWSWWPAVQDRPMAGGRQGRLVMEDLTSTLFWTSEFFYFFSIAEKGFGYLMHDSFVGMRYRCKHPSCSPETFVDVCLKVWAFWLMLAPPVYLVV